MPTPHRSAARIVLLRWWKIATVFCFFSMPITMSVLPGVGWPELLLAPFAFPLFTLPVLIVLLLLLPRGGGGDAERVARAERVPEKQALKRSWPTAPCARGAADEPLE